MRLQSPATSLRKPLAFVVVALALLSAFPIANSIAAGDDQLLALILVAGFGSWVIVFVLGNWRHGVLLLFVWIVFEDLIRKSLGNSMMVYAAKDVMAVAVYVSFLLSQRRAGEPRLKNPLRVPLLAFVAWVILSTFNPAIDNFAVPILGMRMTLFYVPLLYIGYAFFRNDAELRRFLMVIAGVAGIVALMGVLQSFLGLNFLNPADAPNLRLYLTRYSPEAGLAVPRPNATFVDSGRFSIYMFISVFVGLGLIGYLYSLSRLENRRMIRWALTFWAATVVGLILSGGRAAILFTLLSIPMCLLALNWNRRHARAQGRRFPILQVAVVAALFLFLVVGIMPERFVAVYSFLSDTIDPTSEFSEFESRPASYWRDTVRAFSLGGWLGHGTGSASLGRQYLSEFLSSEQVFRYRTQVEGGYASVLWEWGVVGLILWIWWTAALMVVLFNRVRRLRGTRFFWLAVSVSICLFMLLFPIFYMGMPVYQNYVTQAMLWFAAGLVLRLPEAARTPEAPDRRVA